MTRQKADGEFHRPDGSLVTGASDVTREVEALLGLTCGQFTQVAMIAQGDFRKLLEASTEDRVKIFRQIFDTELYQILQDRLKEAAGELKRECDALREDVRRDGAAIQCAGDSEYRNAAMQVRQGALPDEELVPLLDRLLEEDGRRHIALDQKKAGMDGELEKLIAQIKQGELRRKNQKGLDAAREKLEQLEPQIEAAAKALEEALTHQDEIPRLGAQAAQLEGKLSQYGHLQKLTGEIAGLEKQIASEEGRLEDGRAALAEELDRLARDKDELQKLNGAALEAERARQERESLERAVQQLRDLKKDISALERLQNSCQKAREDYQEKAGIAQERADDWQRINRAYLDA